jgi:hypothetical protein
MPSDKRGTNQKVRLLRLVKTREELERGGQLRLFCCFEDPRRLP